ncbi:hypothetical protein ABZ297_16505 [Nonomuraea sp. NPDC005983]|uniref:hypothetical protein n=1 Tax=Nonomuraea sp. NPDC005983 TaxID=3155595 RepID=UPI0033B755AC
MRSDVPLSLVVVASLELLAGSKSSSGGCALRTHRAVATLTCLLVLPACTAGPPPAASPPLSAAPQSLEESMVASGWYRVAPEADLVTPGGHVRVTGLSDVVATGPDTAWAVGYYADAYDEPRQGVLLRMDGKRWRIEERLWKRFPEASDTGMGGIDADGPGNVWAVGNAGVGDNEEDAPFALRLDGHTWRTIKPLGEGKNRSLSDVAVDGSRVVLTGKRWEYTDDGPSFTPILLSWNGKRFYKQEFERGGSFDAVDAGAGHTWIAGSRTPEGCTGSRPAIWHRSSPQEPLVKMRLPAMGAGALRGILQKGPSDVWAVGEAGTGWRCGGGGVVRPLVLHWDGVSWKQAELPGGQGSLHSVTALGSDDVWMVGSSERNSWGVMLLHYSGRRWTREFLAVDGSVEEQWNEYALTSIPGTSGLILVGSAGAEDSEEAIVYRRR